MKQKNLRQKTEAVPQREVSILQKRVNALKLSESPIDVSCFTKEGMIHDFEVFVEQEASDDSEGPEQYLEVDKGLVSEAEVEQYKAQFIKKYSLNSLEYASHRYSKTQSSFSLALNCSKISLQILST